MRLTRLYIWDRRDRMVIWFVSIYMLTVLITTNVIAFESHSGEVYSINIICQWLATGWWFSSGTLVSSTNKTDHHDVVEILLKVALNTISQTNRLYIWILKSLTDVLYSVTRNHKQNPSMVSVASNRFVLFLFQWYLFII